MGKKDYIICAFCGEKLKGSESWIAHIPCTLAGQLGDPFKQEIPD